MVYILCYVVVSILVSLLMGAFIHAGSYHDEN